MPFYPQKVRIWVENGIYAPFRKQMLVTRENFSGRWRTFVWLTTTLASLSVVRLGLRAFPATLSTATAFRYRAKRSWDYQRGKEKDRCLFGFNLHFMRREKFVFNQQTLQYDTVKEPLSYTILRIGAILCAVLITAGLFTVAIHRYLPSPSERLAWHENEILLEIIEEQDKELSLYSDVLSNIQDRDAAAHRMIFGMDPIDDNTWQGGRGGHDAYTDLRSLPQTGERLAELRGKFDRFKHQLDLQSRSLDSITLMVTQKEEMLASIPSIKPIRKDKYSRKMENLSGFGFRIHPIYKVKKMHYGIDFNCAKGTPIQATGKGKVIFAGTKGNYGKTVIIDHGFGYKTLYGHMSEITAKNGQTLERGATVGKVGSTGGSTGDHLHYEVHKNGVPVDPIQYCYDGLTPEEYARLVQLSKRGGMSFDTH